MTMKKFAATVLTTILCSLASLAGAQNVTAAEDTTEIVKVVDVDESYLGKNIFTILSEKRSGAGTVVVNQPNSIRTAMSNHISNNSSRKVNGYRIRIYFDNSQNARSKSQAVADDFAMNFPGVAVYRNHVSPYFKVTVGNFRTRDEAQRFANMLTGRYSSVFLVKERISYPSL